MCLLQTSTCVNEMVPYSLSALEMVAVENNQPATLQNANKHIRDAFKVNISRTIYIKQPQQKKTY